MNVKDMSTEDIEYRLGEVTAEMAEIKAQIGKAKGYAAETGEYSDSDWFHRANLALRLKGREHQALQLEFGKRRKEERRDYNASLEHAFIDAARTKLDATTFRLIMDEALANTGNAPGKPTAANEQHKGEAD